MKKRILIIATSILAVGGVIGGASVVAATNNGEVTDRVAQGLGVTSEELTGAIDTARETAQAERLDAKVSELVAEGTITSAQGGELKTWISSKPDVEGSLRASKGFGKFGGLRHAEGVAETLGTTTENLKQAFETAIEELRAEYEAMTPSERQLFKIETALAGDLITTDEADSLRTWVNSMPSWLNDSDTFKSVLGRAGKGHGKGKRGFGGHGKVTRGFDERGTDDDVDAIEGVSA